MSTAMHCALLSMFTYGYTILFEMKLNETSSFGRNIMITIYSGMSSFHKKDKMSN